MSGSSNPRLGIWLMIAATFVFAVQDGISRHLASEYNVLMVVMIRYWFFAAFVLWLAWRRTGGIGGAFASRHKGLQILRGALLAGEICVTVLAFVYLGLIETHAIFASYPLMIAALAGPVLGERVGWRRWAAVGAGFTGMIVILQPGVSVFSPASLIAVVAAMMFALYGLLTRLAARHDDAMTSFFWTGVSGAVVMTAVGIWFWEPMNAPDSAWMALLCVTGAFGHFLLIKCYDVAEASVVQPFAYFQLIFVSFVGVLAFGETIRANVALGAAMIVAAGLFTFWREQRRRGRASASRA